MASRTMPQSVNVTSSVNAVMLSLPRRFENTLEEEGFGLLDSVLHAVQVMGAGGKWKTGMSRVWLFPGAAKRIFNLDESQVSGTDTQTSNAVRLAPVGIAPGQQAAKKAQTHTTYVAVVSPPEYARKAETINGTDIPAVAAHDGAALPGMVS